jgi:hypothetical protein
MKRGPGGGAGFMRGVAGGAVAWLQEKPWSQEEGPVAWLQKRQALVAGGAAVVWLQERTWWQEGGGPVAWKKGWWLEEEEEEGQ